MSNAVSIKIVDERSILIYCFTNVATGHKYVGQTAGSLTNRWKSHCEGARHEKPIMAFHRAIREHGGRSFVGEVLEIVEGRDESNAAEKRWIATLKTIGPLGYNTGVSRFTRMRSEPKDPAIALAARDARAEEDELRAYMAEPYAPTRAPITHETRALSAKLKLGDKEALAEVVAVLKSKGGNVSETVEALGIKRATWYKWVSELPELAAAVEAHMRGRIGRGPGKAKAEPAPVKKVAAKKKPSRKR